MKDFTPSEKVVKEFLTAAARPATLSDIEAGARIPRWAAHKGIYGLLNKKLIKPAGLRGTAKLYSIN